MLSIRYATKQDMPDIVRVSESVLPSAESQNGFIMTNVGIDTILSDLEHFLVAEYSGEVVGFLWYAEQVPQDRIDIIYFYEEVDIAENTIYISQIAIHPQYQRYGIGRAFYEFVQETFNTSNLVACIMIYPETNVWSMGFHLKLDFKPIGYYLLENYNGVALRHNMVLRRKCK